MIEIKDGAIFIADAHENANRQGFLEFLNQLLSAKIPMPPQLFLMGDMFDFLTAYADYTTKFYAQHIKLINILSQKTQIFYFEGNHDFNLAPLFKNVKIYDISAQPAKFSALDKEAQIAHGDIFLPFISKYALLFLRVKWFLKFMNLVDKALNFKISKQILNKLIQKKLDYKIPNFKAILEPKMAHYRAPVVIEGHYHQGEFFDISGKKYINFSSFACNQSFFIVKYADKEINFIKKSLKSC